MKSKKSTEVKLFEDWYEKNIGVIYGAYPYEEDDEAAEYFKTFNAGITLWCKQLTN